MDDDELPDLLSEVTVKDKLIRHLKGYVSQEYVPLPIRSAITGRMRYERDFPADAEMIAEYEGWTQGSQISDYN